MSKSTTPRAPRAEKTEAQKAILSRAQTTVKIIGLIDSLDEIAAYIAAKQTPAP